jgi:hemerythrin-like metal-binding protein
MDSANRSPDLSVRMNILDRDHREIDAILHELNCASAQQGDVARMVPLLRRFESITLSQFALEDGMMTATQFPGQALHRMRHAWMAEEIKRTLYGWDHPASGLPEQSISMLQESHSNHVQYEDLKFGAWLDRRHMD